MHNEAVTALTTNAFLHALAKFFAGCGRPALIRSDNRTNFRDAYNELIRIVQDNSFQNSSGGQGISGEFIRTSAPHFGGIWEAGIKCVKSFLQKMNTSRFNYEELSIAFVKIQGYLKSRPLTSLLDMFRT